MIRSARQFAAMAVRCIVVCSAWRVACVAAVVPVAAGADPRIRVADYDPGQVYVLQRQSRLPDRPAVRSRGVLRGIGGR